MVPLPTDATVPSVPEQGTESLEALVGGDVFRPTKPVAWSRSEAIRRKRGQFRIYLAAAPGAGKTFAMLGEGARRASRGADVVVGFCATYGRPETAKALEGLDEFAPLTVDYRGRTFDEMDVDGLLARRPDVALVDELAHTNVPGSRHAKRWEDVLDLLAEGITVITTVNVQHLESLNDVVEDVTGIRQGETVPDWIVDLADQVELVDISPYALQRRMLHGNVYPDMRKVDLALRRYFTTENLTALRQLALMRVANMVNDELLQRWQKARIPETRERVLVLVARSEFSDDLVRRGGRIARRALGEFLVLHVHAPEREPDASWVGRTRALAEDLGGTFEVLESDRPVEAVLDFAYLHHVTQVVLGESSRSRWRELARGSFVEKLIGRASNLDIHVIARREG